MDVIILGNGSAGLFAALYAAKLGLRVTIIGKNKPEVPRGGYPSESVHPGLKSLLHLVGADQSISFASRGVYTGIWRNGIFNPLSTIDGEVWEGHHICKSAFEYHLAFCARKACIENIKNDEVIKLGMSATGIELELKSGKKLNSKYLVDATGANRFIGRRFKIPESHYSAPLFACTGLVNIDTARNQPPNETTFIPETHGFTWLAPENSGRCTWTRLRTSSTKTIEVPKLFDQCGQTIGQIYTSNVRWRSFEQVAYQKVFLIGDAACMLDPGTGQGILNACLTATNAINSIATIILNAVKEKPELVRYNDWFREYYLNKSRTLKIHYENLGIKIF